LANAETFEQLYSGRLWSLLSWQQLTDFWARIDRAAGWYLYAVGEPLPTAPATAAEVERFIAETDALLRKEHHHDYCGIVYADDVAGAAHGEDLRPEQPRLSCGTGKHPHAAGLDHEPARPPSSSCAQGRFPKAAAAGGTPYSGRPDPQLRLPDPSAGSRMTASRRRRAEAQLPAGQARPDTMLRRGS
jgi:hypothetical protein